MKVSGFPRRKRSERTKGTVKVEVLEKVKCRSLSCDNSIVGDARARKFGRRYFKKEN